MKDLQRKLDLCATQAVGTRDLWPEIAQRAQNRVRSAPRQAISPLGWVALAVALLVLTGTAAYAAAPILRGVYRINPTWNQSAADASHPVDMSQTQGDCTVTVEQVFADSERILIGGSVHGPETMSLSPTKLSLVTGDGIDLPFVDGAGDAREDGTSAWVWAFDATGLDALPPELDLRLSFELSGIPRNTAPEPMAEPADRRGDGSVVSVELSPIEPTVYGPFRFAFSAPVADPSK